MLRPGIISPAKEMQRKGIICYRLALGRSKTSSQRRQNNIFNIQDHFNYKIELSNETLLFKALSLSLKYVKVVSC